VFQIFDEECFDDGKHGKFCVSPVNYHPIKKHTHMTCRFSAILIVLMRLILYIILIKVRLKTNNHD
jgi:hypothetical protein